MRRSGSVNWTVVISVGMLCVSGVYALHFLAGKPTPGPGPAPVASLAADVDQALDGDAALYYAGVFAALADELESGRGVTQWAQFSAYSIRFLEAADRGEVAPAAVKPIVLRLFAPFDQKRGDIGSDLGSLVAACRSMASWCEAAR